MWKTQLITRRRVIKVAVSVVAMVLWAPHLLAETISPPPFSSKAIEETRGSKRSLLGEKDREEDVFSKNYIWLRALKTIKEKQPTPSIQIRDPFKPLRVLPPIPPKKPPKKADKPRVTPLSPPGKLLSVIHGPEGFQALIQLSSKERIIVEPGGLLKQSGWLVKEISEDRVLLEFVQPRSPSDKSFRSPTGILSFR